MEEVIHKIPNLCWYELEDSNLNKSPSRTYPIPLISTNHPIPLDNHTNMNTKSELSWFKSNSPTLSMKPLATHEF